MTPKQKKRLEKLAKVIDGGEVALLTEIVNLEDAVEEIKQKTDTLPDIEAVIAGVKDGKDGRDGKDGIGIDGKDYILTEKDKREIAKSITVPVVEKVIEKTVEKVEVIKEQPITITEIKEVATLDDSLVAYLEDEIKKGKDSHKTEFEDINRALGIVDSRTSFLINKINNLPTATGGGHTIQDEGTNETQRTKLNFVGAGVDVTDDAGNDATIVTINGGGGGGHTISESDVDVTQRTNLDFLGSHFTVTDDAGNDSTDITLDSTVVTSLGKADTASQPGHTHTLANVNDVTITVANLNTLDDGVNTTLHFHDADRARANHTGTQLASTISDFTEASQDAIGAMVDASLTYVDGTPLLQRSALTGAITAPAGSNATLLGSFTLAQLNTAISDANIVPEAGGTFTGDIIVPAEVYGVGWNASNEAPTKNDVYDQMELKAPLASPTFTGTPSIQPTSPITNPPYALVIDEATTNLCVNPRFENNVTDGWSDVGTVTRTRDTTTYPFGTASMKMVTALTNSGAITTVSVSPNTNYVVSGWMRGDVGGEYETIRCKPNISGGSQSFALAGFTTQLTTTWRRYRWYHTTGASDSTMTVEFRSVDATAQTVYVAGVQIEAKSTTDTTGSIFPSSYCDGSMGTGYSWSGTAHNSTSSRVAGTHHVAPIADNATGSFLLGTDGTLRGKFRFFGDYGHFSKYDSGSSHLDEPFFPAEIAGNMVTNIHTTGSIGGVLLVDNLSDGTALYVRSATTTDFGMVVDGGSITSGTIFAVYAPLDITTMVSSGGKFLDFADKSGASSFAFTPVYSQFGVPLLPYHERYTFFGGGGMTVTNTASRTGTVSITTANATCTGVGTTFLTDYRRGDNIQIEQTPTFWTSYQVASVTSDTVLTLNKNGTAIVGTKAHRSKTRQYKPANLQLSGAYGDFAGGSSTALAPAGDYLYNVFPNGSNGQLHVMKSSAVGNLTGPTENAGDAIVTKRYGSTATVGFGASTAENTIITGYTTPNLELYNGKAFRIKFFGDSDSTNATDTITWRVKIGGTTVLTSAVRQVGTANLMAIEGEIMIVGTSTSAQRIMLSIKGQDTTTVTAVPIYTEMKTGTGSVDCRYADQAITVTMQYGGANGVVNIYNSIIEII